MRYLIGAFLVLASPCVYATPLPFVLLDDPFDTSGNSFDMNFELATRQSGSAAPTAWVEDPLWAAGGPADFMSQVFNTIPAALLAPTEGISTFVHMSPSIGFEIAPRLRVEFEAYPVYQGDGTSPDWVSLSFGTAAGAFPINPGMGFIVRDSGVVDVFDNGVLVASANAGFSESYSVILDLFDLDFLTPGPVRVNLNVGGTQVLTNYVRASGFTVNKLTLGAFNSAPGTEIHYVDSFVVSIPEAHSLYLTAALFGVVAMAMARRRWLGL